MKWQVAELPFPHRNRAARLAGHVHFKPAPSDRMVMGGWILMKTNSSANLRFGLALRGIKDTTCCAKDMLRFEAASGWEEHKHPRVPLESDLCLSCCSALREAKELRSFSWWKYCSPPACKARRASLRIPFWLFYKTKGCCFSGPSLVFGPNLHASS